MDVARKIGHYARELGLTPVNHDASRRREVEEQFKQLNSSAQSRRAAPPVEATVEGEWLGRHGEQQHAASAGFHVYSQAQRHGQQAARGANAAQALSAYQETSTLSLGGSRQLLVDYYA